VLGGVHCEGRGLTQVGALRTDHPRQPNRSDHSGESAFAQAVWWLCGVLDTQSRMKLSTQLIPRNASRDGCRIRSRLFSSTAQATCACSLAPPAAMWPWPFPKTTARIGASSSHGLP
jgi:hypothetical protein